MLPNITSYRCFTETEMGMHLEIWTTCDENLEKNNKKKWIHRTNVLNKSVIEHSPKLKIYFNNKD